MRRAVLHPNLVLENEETGHLGHLKNKGPNISDLVNKISSGSGDSPNAAFAEVILANLAKEDAPECPVCFDIMKIPTIMPECAHQWCVHFGNLCKTGTLTYTNSAVKIAFLPTSSPVKRRINNQTVSHAVEALSGLVSCLRWFGMNQPTLSHLPESCLDVMTSSLRPNLKPSSDIYVCIKFKFFVCRTHHVEQGD